MRTVKTLLLLLVILMANNLYGQTKLRRANNFSSYKDPQSELGYSINAVYQVNEQRLSPQMHLHLIRNLTYFFYIGAGYTSVYDMHFHNSLALEIGLRFTPQMNLALKPGFLLKKIENLNELQYIFGAEATYEFRIGNNTHIGPMVEMNFLQDDTHVSAGFHMGFTF